jgi:hypothetical protein
MRANKHAIRHKLVQLIKHIGAANSSREQLLLQRAQQGKITIRLLCVCGFSKRTYILSHFDLFYERSHFMKRF